MLTRKNVQLAKQVGFAQLKKNVCALVMRICYFTLFKEKQLSFTNVPKRCFLK